MMGALPVRLLAAAFAVMALVWPGYGAIDLSDTWNPEGNPVLSGGWGLFFGVVVAVPFGVVCVAPRRAAFAVWSLLFASAALAAAAAASAEPQAAPLLSWLLLGTLIVASSGAVQPWRTVDLDVNGPVIAVGGVSSPWLLYAWHMSANNRQGRFDTDFTMGVDHYCVQAALGLALTLMVLLAAIWPRGRRHLATTSAVCALYFGVLALRWPDFPGSVPRWWAAGAIAWGAGVCVWGWRRRVVADATPPPAQGCETSHTQRREEA